MAPREETDTLVGAGEGFVILPANDDVVGEGPVGSEQNPIVIDVPPVPVLPSTAIAVSPRGAFTRTEVVGINPEDAFIRRRDPGLPSGMVPYDRDGVVKGYQEALGFFEMLDGLSSNATGNAAQIGHIRGQLAFLLERSAALGSFMRLTPEEVRTLSLNQLLKRLRGVQQTMQRDEVAGARGAVSQAAALRRVGIDDVSRQARDARDLGDRKARLAQNGGKAALEEQNQIGRAARAVDVHGQQAAIVRGVADEQLPEVMADMHAESGQEVRELKGTLDMLRRWINPLVTVGSQLVSGGLTANGIKAMRSALNATGFLATWSLGGLMALVINGSLLGLSSAYQAGSFTFLNQMFPEDEDDGSVKRFLKKIAVYPSGVGALFLLFALASNVTNIAGFVYALQPTAVTQAAAEGPIGEVDAYLALIRRELAPRMEESNDLITSVQAQGKTMQQESVALGVTGDYGFKEKSREELVKFNKAYEDASKQLVANGDCDGLKRLQDVYANVYKLLEDERLRKGDKYAESPFDANSGDLKANLASCEAANPDSPSALAAQAEKILDSIRKDVESGKIQEPTLLNPDLHRLNGLMTKLQGQLNITAPELSELDPPAWTALKMVVESAVDLTTYLVAGTQRALGNESISVPEVPRIYPLGLGIIAVLLDYIGLVLGVVTRNTRKKYQEALKKQKNALTDVDFGS